MSHAIFAARNIPLMHKAGDLLHKAAKALENFSSHSARDARILLAHVLKISSDTLFFNLGINVSLLEAEKFQELLQRYLSHEPLSKIIGEKEFYGRSFYTNNHVLDPRPDSEVLIDVAKKYAALLPSPLTILELGVGSGCLLITLILELQKYHKDTPLTGVGCDISFDALDVARKNIEKFQLQDRISLIQSDWFSHIEAGSIFSLIISNPPYIEDSCFLEPSVYEFDPHVALFGGPDGLEAYKIIASRLRPFLKEKSFFMCEMGQGQGPAVREIFEGHGFLFQESMKDLSGIERVAVFS